MLDFMSKYTAQTYALLRIVAGFLFLFHGTQKVFGFPGGSTGGARPFHIAWIAGPIELIGGVLLMIGLFTRPVAFLCSGLMAFAYWMSHGTRGAFAHRKPRRTCGALLLPVPLHLRLRGWDLERGRAQDQVGGLRVGGN